MRDGARGSVRIRTAVGVEARHEVGLGWRRALLAEVAEHTGDEFRRLHAGSCW
jgi:hypothetical protein